MWFRWGSHVISWISSIILDFFFLESGHAFGPKGPRFGPLIFWGPKVPRGPTVPRAHVWTSDILGLKGPKGPRFGPLIFWGPKVPRDPTVPSSCSKAQEFLSFWRMFENTSILYYFKKIYGHMVYCNTGLLNKPLTSLPTSKNNFLFKISLGNP